MLRIPPPVLALSAGALQALLSRHRHSSHGSRVSAGLLVPVCLALDISSLRAFRRRQTTINPLKLDSVSELVTDSANALTRNPMYLSLAGLLLAHALWRRSALALLPAAGFVLLLDKVQIPAEEAALEKAFGQRYFQYQRQVPRWVSPRTIQRLLSR
ncbi:methyltransferase family protein [Glutamicibacter sp. AOP38-B1-38]|uniref:methyltransferase family protein n=1 Tax=Glutamicibacter sp. AOP38-B1-38 TaxID=3457680 RepID=UPI00403468F6